MTTPRTKVVARAGSTKLLRMPQMCCSLSGVWLSVLRLVLSFCSCDRGSRGRAGALPLFDHTHQILHVQQDHTKAYFVIMHFALCNDLQTSTEEFEDIQTYTCPRATNAASPMQTTVLHVEQTEESPESQDLVTETHEIQTSAALLVWRVA